MPFSQGQNELDGISVFRITDGKYAPTSGTTVVFGFHNNSALTITNMGMTVNAATGGFGVLKADLTAGLTGTGEVLMTCSPTAATTLVSGTSYQTAVNSTSLYATFVPARTDLALKITTSAAGDIVTGLTVFVNGRRYQA